MVPGSRDINPLALITKCIRILSTDKFLIQARSEPPHLVRGNLHKFALKIFHVYLNIENVQKKKGCLVPLRSLRLESDSPNAQTGQNAAEQGQAS